MSQKYYIRFRGKVRGPFTVARLHILATRRRFGRHYEVSTDRVHWSSAAEYPDLFSRPKKSSVREPRPQEVTADDKGHDTQDDTHPDVASAQDDKVWYYMQDEQQLGPVGFQELRSMAELGTLTAETFVWHEGLDEWIEAQQVPDLLPDWATVGLTSGGRSVRSSSTRHKMNYEKLFLRIVLGGLAATLLIGVGIFLMKQSITVVKQIVATSDQNEPSETDVSPFAQPGEDAEPAEAGDAVIMEQPDDSDAEDVPNEGASRAKVMKSVDSSTSGDEPDAQQPRQPKTPTATDEILGEWTDSKGYVTLKLAAGGSGCLFLFSEGGGSGPANAGDIQWKLSGQEITFSGAAGKGTGVLQENGTEIVATIGEQEFVLARQ